MYANLWDMKAYFDCQVLKESLLSLLSVSEVNEDSKSLRLSYNLKVQVPTYVGLTETASTGEITGQSSFSFAIVSSLNPSRGLGKSFSTSNYLPIMVTSLIAYKSSL